MRFAQKLTLTIVLLLCVTLSAGGAWNIQQNLNHALNTALQQDTALHQRECYMLEARIMQETGVGAVHQKIAESVKQYAEEMHAASGQESAAFAVFTREHGISLYSGMPSDIPYMAQYNAVQNGADSAQYVRTPQKEYLLLASPLHGTEEDVWMVSAYDVSPLFQERDRQVRQYLVLEVAALILAGGAAVGISLLLTRPLRHLEAASHSIAAGNYGSRVEITSKDEVGQLSQTFNTMADAVQNNMEALVEESQRQKRFVAAFTHELKTPMTAILGYADLLRSGEQPAPRRQKASNYIYHESARLEALSGALLQLLGLEHEQLKLVPTPMTQVLVEMQRSLPQLEVQLQVDCPQNAVVLAEHTLLADLLRNLVLNAAAASPARGRVAVRCGLQGEKWAVCVEDWGQGIPEEELDKILEPFYRVDKSRARKNGGNGLGLNLCAQIAQLHGSSLQIESRLGQGTTVTLLLKKGEKL